MQKPSLGRRVLAWVATIGAGALGALILGEYEFSGWTPYVSGVLFGLVLSEVELTIGRDHRVAAAGAVGILTAGGLSWAAWISSGRGVAPIPVSAWVGAALGAVVAFSWIRWSAKRGASSPTGP
jgi:hypothetical protein